MRTWLVPFLVIPLALGCGDKTDDSDPGSDADGSDCSEGFGLAEDGNCYPIDDTPNGDRVEGSEASDCSDEADNDLDGLFDCDDDGCEGSPACEEADADADADADTDTDADADADTDADADADADDTGSSDDTGAPDPVEANTPPPSLARC